MTGLLDAICAADSAAARQAGWQEGLEQGRARGEAKGVAKGREEVLPEMARMLVKEYGTPPEAVASRLKKPLSWVLEALQE